MKIIKIKDALKRLEKINREIRYKSCAEGKGFTAGLISFRPNPDADPKQIHHHDKDVLCHVIRGRGRLRVNGRRIGSNRACCATFPKERRTTLRREETASWYYFIP